MRERWRTRPSGEGAREDGARGPYIDNTVDSRLYSRLGLDSVPLCLCRRGRGLLLCEPLEDIILRTSVYRLFLGRLDEPLHDAAIRASRGQHPRSVCAEPRARDVRTVPVSLEGGSEDISLVREFVC